jgi:NAD(P)-dependent dehydrogenase (short-subunit alcohol dehydrogenase family)
VTLLFVGLDVPETRGLADALGADLVAPPPIPDSTTWGWDFSDEIDAFARSLADGPPVSSVVVCTWSAHYRAQQLVDTTPVAWVDEVERPLALWFRVLTEVVDRIADGGALAVVVERPAPIDSNGHAGTSAVAEGLVALTRSLALIQGPRNVRANVVGTEISTAPELLLGLAPALPSFPGTPDLQVAGAVRMVLSLDAAGVTGTLVRADSGRSW